jgi:hypothetical protein
LLLNLPQPANPGLVAAVLSFGFANLPLDLCAFAVEPTLPARRIPTDNGRIDDERLPSPRRAQCSREDGIGSGIRDPGSGTRDCGPGIRNRIVFLDWRLDAPERLILRRRPGSLFLLTLQRDLGERQVLGKSGC